jgi:bifunctional non-homologous end joining protein LigD
VHSTCRVNGGDICHQGIAERRLTLSIRALYLDRGAVRLLSRGGRDLIKQTPELATIGRTVARRRLIPDGELVAAGEEGRPDFEGLQSRMMGDGRAPLTLVVFDNMHSDGDSTMALPLEERKRRLGELALNGASWRTD